MSVMILLSILKHFEFTFVIIIKSGTGIIYDGWSKKWRAVLTFMKKDSRIYKP